MATVTGDIDAVARETYSSVIKHAYQSGHLLSGAYYFENSTDSKLHKFRLMGKSIAKVKTGTSQMVDSSDIDHTLIECPMGVLYDKKLDDYEINKPTVNFDPASQYVMALGYSMGRGKDQLLLDALDNAVVPAANTIAVGTTNLTLAKIRAASKVMNAGAVPNGDRIFLINAAGLSSLQSEATFTSIDYNQNKPLTNGQIYQYMGFKFIVIDDRVEGGLPLTGTTATCFAYDKRALGMAMNYDITSEVTRQNLLSSWLIEARLLAGAVAIDPAGIVKVNIKIDA